MSQLEEQLINVIGNYVVYGESNIQEAGLIINLNESAVDSNANHENMATLNILEGTSKTAINENVPEVVVETSVTQPISSMTKRKASTLSSLVEAFQQNGICYVSELQSIRNELKKIRKIKKFKALVEYHKSFIKYPNFPNIEMSDSE